MQKASLKRIVLAAALVGSAIAANAATTDLGTLGSGAKAFSGKVLGGAVPSPFGDFFTFELPASGGSAYSVVNFPVAELNLNLAFNSLALFSMGADGAIGGVGANEDILRASANGVVGTGSQSLNVNLGPTASPQNMYLHVSGFTTGSAGGIYSGAISVSPVPEPEVWAMMLVGAGLVGFPSESQANGKCCPMALARHSLSSVVLPKPAGAEINVSLPRQTLVHLRQQALARNEVRRFRWSVEFGCQQLHRGTGSLIGHGSLAATIPTLLGQLSRRSGIPMPDLDARDVSVTEFEDTIRIARQRGKSIRFRRVLLSPASALPARETPR